MTEHPENPSKKAEISLAFYSTSGDDALSVLRVLGPARAAGVQVNRGIDEIDADDHDSTLAEDLIVIQRDYCRNYARCEQLIEMAHDSHKPVVLDLDDLLLELPPEHPDRISGYFADALLPILSILMEVDLVTVPTEPLRQYLLPYNRNVKVIPNYLDDSLWKLNPRNDARKPGDRVTIGYMGGHSHEHDLKMMLPALLQILEKYQGRVIFKSWGIRPPNELNPYSIVDWCPPESLLYSDFARYFQTQTADICIAPLTDNSFNACKSPIKYFEYSAIGAPVVCSRVKPYENIVEDGKDGLMAASTEEWVEAIRRLIESPELGSQLVEHAQKKIHDHWRLSQNAHKQFEIYQQEIKNQGAVSKPKPNFMNLVKSITIQAGEKRVLNEAYLQRQLVEVGPLKDEVQRLEDRIKEDEERLSAQSSQIDGLNEEVLEYATSKSWRWTRPFRKISKHFYRSRRRT